MQKCAVLPELVLNLESDFSEEPQTEVTTGKTKQEQWHSGLGKIIESPNGKFNPADLVQDYQREVKAGKTVSRGLILSALRLAGIGPLSAVL